MNNKNLEIDNNNENEILQLDIDDNLFESSKFENINWYQNYNNISYDKIY